MFEAGKKATRTHIEELVGARAHEIADEATYRVHVITGYLRSTIYASDPTWDGDVCRAEVGATAPYAEIEEFRPGNHAYLRPALHVVAARYGARVRP